MPKYFCDYCDTYLTHDSPSVRKTHNGGRKHKDQVRFYYERWLQDQTGLKLLPGTMPYQMPGKPLMPTPLMPPQGMPPQGMPPQGMPPQGMPGRMPPMPGGFPNPNMMPPGGMPGVPPGMIPPRFPPSGPPPRMGPPPSGPNMHPPISN